LPQPPAPQSVIVMGYEFGPDGAQFDPPLKLTLTYDPKTLPFGAEGDKVKLAFWDGSKWVSVDSTLDPVTHAVTAQISHFSEYALIAELPPAKFTLSDLKITTDKTSPDSLVTIQTVVTNVGGNAGKYIAKLTLNSFGVNQKEISLEAGKTETVTFELKNLIPAKYYVGINEKSNQFSVEEPVGVTAEVSPGLQPQSAASTPVSIDTPIATPPVNTPAPLPENKTTFPAIWLILGIVIVAGLLITGIFIMRRRAK
jgi:hypothetical protein